MSRDELYFWLSVSIACGLIALVGLLTATR